MAEKPQSYYGTWINRQRSLLPGLDQELDPLTAKLEHLIIILDTLGLEAFVAPPSRGRGRPPDDRPAIARSFVAKAVLTIPTTSALIERLQIDRALRRICGWERRSDVPSEATFSRAFAEFAAQGLPERVHEQLVRRHLQDHIVGHISRDATEIEAREKPRRRSSDDPPPPAPPKRKRGRPRKHEVLPPKPLTRIEQQRTQSLDEMRAGLPTQCDVGVKRNSKGFRETWIGYKLHLDTANGIVPVAAILTAASIHDSQVAIPLARTSEQRVVWLYDLMDSAYDAQPIIDDCLAAGRVPVIDRNTRRDTALKAEIAAERARRRLIKLPDPRDLTYNERTTAERANARIKDEFGGRHLRVRGHFKAFCHLMFGVVALAADSIVRLFSARFYIHPA
ncbi:MAG TPA: transposase [Acetobacteraceae bacterium]|nr:transposase [Acetobacteraceae bacterium]